MGTYTTNKNLFMPTVGETGWGTLVNGNFETIDNFLKPISLSGSTYTFTGNQTGGTITATKITNSGTLTNTGKITANGGITSTTGTFSGAVTGATFNGVTISTTAFNGVSIGHRVKAISDAAMNAVPVSGINFSIGGGNAHEMARSYSSKYNTTTAETWYVRSTDGYIFSGIDSLPSGWNVELYYNSSSIGTYTITITGAVNKTITTSNARYGSVTITPAEAIRILNGSLTVKFGVSYNTTGYLSVRIVNNTSSTGTVIYY